MRDRSTGSVGVSEEWFDLEVDAVLRSTPDAILVRISMQEDEVLSVEGYQRDIWIPRSQLVNGCEYVDQGDSGELNVALWFAQKKGWF